MKRKNLIIFGIVLLALLGGAAWFAFQSRQTTPDMLATSATDTAESISADERHTMGDPKAKIVLIEYGALTCPTCAFVNAHAMPDLKRKYIDTGKVLYVYRLYPIDPSDGKAESLAACLPKERYFDFIDMLYRRQAEWGPEQMGEHGPEYGPENQPKSDAGLIKMARVAGLDADKAKTCLNDKAVQAVVNQISEAGRLRYGITGTPTIVINGQVFPSVPGSVDDLARVIDPLLEGK